MKYEFIKIENTREGMMAYMLDHERGVVVIAPVEYLGEMPAEKPVRMPRRVEYVEEELPPVRTVRRAPVQEVVEEEVVDHTPVIRGGKVAGEGIDPSGLKDIGTSRPQKTQSIMPPHLRGILKKDGAVEKRETIG